MTQLTFTSCYYLQRRRSAKSVSVLFWVSWQKSIKGHKTENKCGYDEETKVFLDLIHQKKITTIFNRNHQRNAAIHKDLNECSPKALIRPGLFILVPAYFPLQSAAWLFHHHSRTLQPSLYAPDQSAEALRTHVFLLKISVRFGRGAQRADSGRGNNV